VTRVREAFMRMRRHKVKVICFGLVAAGVIFYLEPLEPRFEGLTVRQWIERNADRREFPRREVVEYFGESAVPVLVRELQPSGLFQFTLTFERATGKSWLNVLRPADFDRRMACADWAKRLMAIDPEVFTRLATRTSDNHEALEIARLFYGDHYLRETLRAYARQSTNAQAQARATQLLEYYREMI
jgi:hypothetical protein